MRSKARLVILLSPLFLTGMRDPFSVPEERCAAGQLSQWRYQGIVSGSRDIGLMQDGQKRWHRVKTQMRLPTGWRVSAIDRQQLTVDVGDMCEPKRWTWQREGTKKVKIRIGLLLAVLSQPLWAATPKPVTLLVDDVPVVQILQALVAQEDRNLVVSPDVSGSLSLNLTRVPWRQALQTVVNSAGLVLREEGGIFMCIRRPGNGSNRRVKSRSGPSVCSTPRCTLTAFRLLMRMRPNCKKRRKSS